MLQRAEDIFLSYAVDVSLMRELRDKIQPVQFFAAYAAIKLQIFIRPGSPFGKI